jgi:hypothetical protein
LDLSGLDKGSLKGSVNTIMDVMVEKGRKYLDELSLLLDSQELLCFMTFVSSTSYMTPGDNLESLEVLGM